ALGTHVEPESIPLIAVKVVAAHRNRHRAGELATPGAVRDVVLVGVLVRAGERLAAEVVARDVVIGEFPVGDPWAAVALLPVVGEGRVRDRRVVGPEDDGATMNLIDRDRVDRPGMVLVRSI